MILPSGTARLSLPLYDAADLTHALRPTCDGVREIGIDVDGLLIAEGKVEFVEGPVLCLAGSHDDEFYGADLELTIYGRFSIQICNIETFVRKFLPPGVYRYSFDDKNVRAQIVAEFMQSFIVAVNSLSAEYRISQLPSQANTISKNRCER